MKSLSFTNFLKEKLSPLTKIKPLETNSLNHTQKLFWLYWSMVLSLLFVAQLANAQNTFVTCNEVFFDDGGATGSYTEDRSSTAVSETFTICPENPTGQVIEVEFSQFDVFAGDTLLVYDGNTADSILQITSTTAGEGSGASIANAPGGGLIKASCNNLSGCLTFVFNKNNDGTTAAGWAFLAECSMREDYSFPVAGTTQQITSADGVCSPDGLVGISIEIPDYVDCEGNGLIVSADCPEVTISQISNTTVLVNAPIGTTNISFISPLFPSEVATIAVQIIPTPLTCNLALEVSPSGDCIIPLTPDMLLEGPCMSSAYQYEVSFLDPNRDDLSDMAVIGQTPEGYPLVDFSGVPCGAHIGVRVERRISTECGIESTDICVSQMVLEDRVEPVLDGEVDDYLLACYYETDDLLDRLNAVPKDGRGFDLTFQPTGVAGMTNTYDFNLIVEPISDVFTITENCAAQYEVSEWRIIDLDCTTDEFDLYGTYDHDDNPNTPEIPVAQDPVWALMGIEVEGEGGGTPAVFRCYFRSVVAVDDCGNESNVAIQRICIAQPDIVFPLVEIDLGCQESTDPIEIYNKWASDPDANAKYATFIPIYDRTPLDLNGNFSLFGNLDDTYFTDNSGDEIPVFPEDGACGYAIDWDDSEPIQVCGESYKIFREWTVFNFCDGHLEILDVVPQVIQVGDTDAPSVDLLGIEGLSGLYENCVADAIILLDIKDECSNTAEVYIDFIGDDKPELPAEIIDGGVRVNDVPLGQQLDFTIRLVDECWNTSLHGPFTVAQIKDNIPPVAICESFRTVSLGIECEVLIPAETFDDGSYDNCGNVAFSVARMDATGNDGILFNENFDFFFEGDEDVFGPNVIFTKEDLVDCESTVQVIFRVEDGCGNANFCMVDVNLQDKIPPVVKDTDLMYHCQDTFACNLMEATLADNPNLAVQDLLNTAGILSAAEDAAFVTMESDNCDNAVMLVDFVDATDFNPHCKEGNIVVFYQAIDACGNVSFPGVVNVQVKRKSDWIMQFPMDEIFYCEDSTGIPPAVTLDNILENHGCDTWGMEVKEDRFDSDGICAKIVRSYHLINFCSWNPSNTEVAVIERPAESILDPFYTVSLRYRDDMTNGIPDSAPDGLNDFDDGDEDGDGEYIYKSTSDRFGVFAPISIEFSNSELDRIQDNGEANAFDLYDVTDRSFDADFVVIDPTDFAYQSIPTYSAISQFSGVTESYVSAQDYGNIMYRQIVKINDVTPPMVEVLQAGEFCGGEEDPGEGGLCTGMVELKFSAKDLCEPELEVSYDLIAFVDTDQQMTFDRDPFGSLVFNSEAMEYKINGFYPIGKHQILVWVVDGCGNATETLIDFEVVDCKAPTIVCYYGLSADLSAQGEVTIWNYEYANYVEDFCSEVLITFGDPAINPDSTARTFRCADGEIGVVPVQVWVSDEAGNKTFCETFINIQSNPQNGDIPDACPTANGAVATISGAIQTTEADMMPEVEVHISGDLEITRRTSIDGDFLFPNLEKGGDYSIAPSKKDDLLNGVSTFDLVLISKHILNIEPFESPYQIIAADINNSNTVTTFDMIALRKVILGIDNQFPNNDSWRFVPEDHVFDDPSNPLASPFPEQMSINDLQEDYRMNFVAVKVGDVNESASAAANGAIEGRSFAGQYELTIEDQQLEIGQIYRVPVQGNAEEIAGYQFTMNLEGVELLNIEEGLLKANHFGQFEQFITASWNREEENMSSDIAFTLILQATANSNLSEALRISSDKTKAAAYDAQGIAMNVNLSFTGTDFNLAQNQPNPFQGQTTINLQLPHAQYGTLKVHDLTGKVLKVIEQQFEQGENQIILDSNTLPSGVLYYTLESTDFKATRKMVVLER
ncbi:MAG: T9SS type A sorting domain-containing protein [Bacteroidota bacterium]